MDKKKSWFRGYSNKEVEKMERNLFCIQFGGDFLCEDGYYLFTKSESGKMYDITVNDLCEIVQDGNDKDRNYALDLIATTQILPFRLH